MGETMKWRMVPEEPTPEMVEAGKHAHAWEVRPSEWGKDDDGEWISPAPIKMYPAYVYRAMLAAAPPAPPPATELVEALENLRAYVNDESWLLEHEVIKRIDAILAKLKEQSHG